MSGGSWSDAQLWRWEDVVYRLVSSREGKESCHLLRRALGNQILLAMHAIQEIDYVDSGDKSPGDEREALEKCFKETGVQVEARELLTEIERLKVEVERVCAGMTQE